MTGKVLCGETTFPQSKNSVQEWSRRDYLSALSPAINYKIKPNRDALNLRSHTEQKVSGI